MQNIEIKKYVDKLLEGLGILKEDFIGVIVYGSYIGGRENKLSDLDVMVILQDYKTADCGSQIIDGVRVEYFVQDLKKLYLAIREEINNNDPSHLTKFATGKVFYDTENKVEEFIRYAKMLYETKIEGVLSDKEYFSIFSIKNRMEDLESLLDMDSFYAVYFVTLEKIRGLYGRIHGCIELPLMKIEKLYKDKEFAKKYIASDTHRLPAQEFIHLYLNCLKIEDRIVMLEHLKQLFAYSFGDLDFNPENFVLKFKKNPPFKV